MLYDAPVAEGSMRARRGSLPKFPIVLPGLGQRWLSRRSITILVVLAFASLLLFTIVRHPTFSIESDEQNLGSETLADSTLSGKAAELPHDPNIKSSSNSLTQKAADAVEQLVAITPHSIFDFKADSLGGDPTSLSEYSGQVVLIVNVASLCGFTDTNYKELEILYQKYQERGFVVLAFPCNQFGNQEPGTPSEIETIARQKYKATFPIFEKVDVNGEDSHPLFKYLKDTFGMKQIPWNFQKFLVNRAGHPVHQYPSQIDPLAIENEIVKLLDEHDGG
mmetsp:Transcript_2871/g.6625  ORF Transcript_2871/g.6625 Transcript_2871/m.6625 type:complete len:278 (-) Transcript_2871:204-1037(-)